MDVRRFCGKMIPVPTVMILIIALSVSACSSLGPGRISPDRFDYNDAIANSSNEQMLLNLVRLRYLDVPVFLAVSSVLTQYVFTGNVGVIGSASVGSSASTVPGAVGGSAGIRYIERPTITYSPLSGEDFSRQLLTPIPADLIFSLIQSGWPAKEILTMSVQRINNVVNPNPGQYASALESGLHRPDQFTRMIYLIVKLGQRGALELQRADRNGSNIHFLVFDRTEDPETLTLIAEFKRLLDLDPDRDRFRVTTDLAQRESDEVAIRIRSMLTLMGFLSRGVDVPIAHVEHSHISALTTQPPLQIRSSTEKPSDAFVAVLYRGHWFYIDRSDRAGKQAFGLLTYLLQLKAPRTPSTAPLLTIPTG